MKKNIGLIPLRNFAILGDNLFRSAQPQFSYEYDWMKRVLGIDIIINLRSEKDMDTRFSIPHDIKTFTISVPDHNPPKDEDVEKFQNILHENKGKKILFHCEHGHGRTSTFCVIARIENGWTLDEAIQEEKEKFHYAFQHKAQMNFLINKFQKQAA